MKNLIKLIAVMFLVTCCCSCMQRIDAGHEGIKVNLYGSNKGVDDVELVTGMVWYNPFTERVYEYPTFVQTVDYEPFEFNSKDGSVFVFDPTVMLNITPGTASAVFIKYRQSLDDVLESTLVPFIHDAFKSEINARTDNELISNQAEFQDAIENRLREELGKENFYITKVVTGIKYPDELLDAILKKNKAIQDQARVENEIIVAKSEKEKAIIQAQAEKEANELRSKALTPAVLEQMWIEKWNGVLPVYGTVPTLFKDITQ